MHPAETILQQHARSQIRCADWLKHRLEGKGAVQPYEAVKERGFVYASCCKIPIVMPPRL